jgi:putative membrane protein insertion efficiency factor
MNRIAKNVLLTLLRGYKWALSPMLPPACRYVPTCSEYAIEAVECYGALRGTAMAIWRLLRCHPFASGGFDPVPLRISNRVQAVCADSVRVGAAVHVRPSTTLPTFKSHA